MSSVFKRSLPAFVVATFSAALLFFVRPACHADTLHGKADFVLSRRFSKAAETGWSSVILAIRGELSPHVRSQIERGGAYIYRHLPFIQSVAVRIPNRRLPALAAQEFVRGISDDSEVRKTDEFTNE